jgi:hypothetical protein
MKHLNVGPAPSPERKAMVAALARANVAGVTLVNIKPMQENAQQVAEEIISSKEPKQTVVVDDTPKAPVDPELQVKPKASCRHCYGRGYIGTDAKTKKKVMCRCVQKDFLRVNKLKKQRDQEIKDAEVTASKGW